MKPRWTLLAAVAAFVPLTAASGGIAGAGTQITTCGQVVTANAVLTRDLVCPGQSGIVVGASGITIDLNGHTLRGNRSVNHFGVDDNAGFDAVTIENGTLRNFGDGVAAMNATRVNLSNLVAAGNLDTGLLVFADFVSVSSSTVAENGQEGMHIGGVRARIKAATAVGNTQVGIDVRGKSAKIQSSTASGNGVIGIFVDGDAPVLSANHADGNGFAEGVSDGVGQGIVLSGFTTAPKGRNDARGNDDPAECDPAALCGTAAKTTGKGTPIATCAQVVTANAFLTADLTCPGQSGVVVGASGITIDLNGHTLRGDGTANTFGIDDDGGFADVTIRNGVVRGFFEGVQAFHDGFSVSISDVIAAANADAGIVAGGVASVRGSTFSGNGSDGLVVEGNFARITGSAASGNAESGYAVDGSSDTIQGSSAFGNGSFGIGVVGNSDTVDASTAAGNSLDGISVGGEGSVIKGNRADGNGRQGVAATGFQSLPKGKNVARGNDSLAQCDPASLC